MPPVRERVEKLIALALHNSNPEEARSAAMKAVSLIQEHKLLDGPQRPTFNYGFTQSGQQSAEELRRRAGEWAHERAQQQRRAQPSMADMISYLLGRT